MIDQLSVNKKNECPGEESIHEIATLTGISPNLELKAMTANRVQVFLLMESELELPVISAMIVIEQEIMVCRYCCDT